MNDDFLARLSQDETSSTPREIVHLPERVQWKEEREGWDGKDVEDHPPDHVPLSAKNEHPRLKTVDGGDHDQRQGGDTFAFACDEIDEIYDL